MSVYTLKFKKFEICSVELQNQSAVKYITFIIIMTNTCTSGVIHLRYIYHDELNSLRGNCKIVDLFKF